MNKIIKGIRKFKRIFRGILLLTLYRRNILISSILNIDLAKNVIFTFVDRTSKLIIKGKLIVSNFVCIKICENANLEIGNRVFFNNYCSITAMNQITIGNNCLFGENVHIYDHNHKYKDSTQRVADQGFAIGGVTIGDNVWVGSNVTILKDVAIGNNCVIGAGCTVYKNIPDNHILLSNGQIKSITEKN